jgi:hypothetical protein
MATSESFDSEISPGDSGGLPVRTEEVASSVGAIGFGPARRALANAAAGL